NRCLGPLPNGGPPLPAGQGVSGTAGDAARKAGPAGAVGPARRLSRGKPAARSTQAMPVRGRSASEAARAGNDPPPSRGSRASPARDLPGLQENCCSPAAEAAAATLWAILIISLTVTHFIMSPAGPGMRGSSSLLSTPPG